MILNVDRSAPEHAVHSTGSVGGGGQRGTGHGGPKGAFRTRRRSYFLVLLESTSLFVRLFTGPVPATVTTLSQAAMRLGILRPRNGESVTLWVAKHVHRQGRGELTDLPKRR